MKKLLIVLILSVILFYGCIQTPISSQYSSSHLRILTEDFPPYNFKNSDGKLTGQSTELVRTILKNLNQTSDIELMEFSKAYSILSSGPNVMFYSVGRTSEREDKFKWVGPIGQWELTLYASKNSDISSSFSSAKNDADRTEIAKSVSKICVVKDDVRHQYLVANGFKNIDAVAEDAICAKKLASEQVDLWFGSSTSFEKIVNEAKLQTSYFSAVYSVEKNDLYFAFSKDVPDSVISAWQKELNAIKSASSCNSGFSENDFRNFVISYENKVIQLTNETGLAYFVASISGKDGDYAKASEKELELTKIYTSKEDFAKLSGFKNSGCVTDPILKRELDLIYLSYLSNQVDQKKLEKLIELQTEVEQEFNTYRVTVNGSTLTDNEVDDILINSIDSEKLEQVWVSSKKIGALVSEKVILLVKLRNEIARDLGFKNYQEMQLILSEQDPEQIQAIFDELDNQTISEYTKLKAEMDESLSLRYGVPKENLMPWHYQNRFFQSAPASVYAINFDSYYAGKDLVKITEDYYSSMGMPVDDVLNRSDLYEKPGKYQHAYATDIDRSGDVRIVTNIRPNAYWMDTILHESGHAVYFKYINSSLPWTLRGVDTQNTEAIAMLFGEMARKPEWMQSAIGLSEGETNAIMPNSTKYLTADKLVFSRWAQVMYRFEKSMYENPDQDINKLWWDLVEKYQMIKKPEGRNEPDWASKIHVATSPIYYHNYMLGWLILEQTKHHIQSSILNCSTGTCSSFYGRTEVGNYLRNQVFSYGLKYPWYKEIEIETGENLTAKYFAMEVSK